jgi:GNAT superfamily N-acetyltransferase
MTGSPSCQGSSERSQSSRSHLAVTLADGTLAGFVSWRTIKAGGPDGGCLEIGALLFPEQRGRGLGTVAQRLLVEYLFATTPANRLQAITDVENRAEQHVLERIGFRREGVMRGLAFIGWALARRRALRPATGRSCVTAASTSPVTLAIYWLAADWLACQSPRSRAYHATRAPLWVNSSWKTRPHFSITRRDAALSARAVLMIRSNPTTSNP